MEPHLALTERWSIAGTATSPEAEVAALERRYRIRLPEDFRLYLLRAVPPDGYWDDYGIFWWPISRIKNMPDECGPTPGECANPEIDNEADHYLFFADYVDWCYAWAICCSDGANRGKVAISATPDFFVADGFSRFVELALADSRAIHIGSNSSQGLLGCIAIDLRSFAHRLWSGLSRRIRGRQL